MENKKLKLIAGFVVIMLGVSLAAFSLVKAFSGSANNVFENVQTVNIVGSGESMGGDVLGGAVAPAELVYLKQNFKNGFFVNGTDYWTSAGDLSITDDVAIGGDVTVGGGLAITGETTLLESYEAVTATNTITVAESGTTFYLSGATSSHTLPATSTAAGTVYRFVVDGSVTGNITITTAGGADIIEGALIVAGAVVDCDAEDTITIVADGENLGDFVELRSNGTNWFIGASGALTASKMTCTAS
jgi:hypothetical protein